MTKTFAARRVTLILVLLLCACSLSAAAQTPLTLFNSSTLLGWNPRGVWGISGGAISTNGSAPRGISFAVPFEDFDLVFDYNESNPMDARLRLWTTREGSGGASVDLDGSGAKAHVGGVEDASPSPIASMTGGWHHVQVEASQGRLSIHVDNMQAGTSNGSGPHAGYLGWEVGGNGTFQVRNVKLTPRGLTSAFNGTDLGGWKAVAEKPSAKGGVGHEVEKTLTFGLGGGSTKPHEAKWTVQGGAMHGENGPGGLEYSSQMSDAVIEITAGVHGEPKPEHFTALAIRNPPGQISGGYMVGIGPFRGGIEKLVKRGAMKGEAPAQETIAIGGRTIAIWSSGTLLTVNTDPRPESGTVDKGPKTSAGALDIVFPGDGVQVNVTQVAVAVLPKNFGASAVAKAPPAPAPVPSETTTTTPTPAPVAPPPPSPVETAMLKQQQTAAQQQDQDRASKQRVAGLMASALATSDPQKQMDLYNQVVQIDPSNAPAVQGYKDAQAKVQAAQAAQQQTFATEVNQQHQALTRDQQVNGSLVKAQGAFLAGHLSEASQALNVAERLAPDNPLVRDLRGRISASNQLQSRMLMLGSGAGLLALVALIALWIRRGRMKRFPMLEVTDGLDAGEQYPLDKDTIHIGAVAQDGAQKNDIVVRDVEHKISRFHCEITKANGQLWATDLSSSNGTKVDGVALVPGQPAVLRSGARLRLANTAELRLGYARRKVDAPRG